MARVVLTGAQRLTVLGERILIRSFHASVNGALELDVSASLVARLVERLETNVDVAALLIVTASTCNTNVTTTSIERLDDERQTCMAGRHAFRRAEALLDGRT